MSKIIIFSSNSSREQIKKTERGQKIRPHPRTQENLRLLVLYYFGLLC